ncbi:MAG TPA: hypothetical protein VF060_18990 [Trebonia sp.]
MSERDVMDCGEFSDVAAELALGVLTGRERADALAHLERCDECRETVRQLAITGEELVGLLPAVEPPPGFETRVLTRIGVAPGTPSPGRARRLPSLSRLLPRSRGSLNSSGQSPNPRPPRGRRRLLAVGATALAVIAAGLGGWGLGTGTSPAHLPVSASAGNHIPLSSAALVSSNHQTVGTVFYYSGAEPWMYMSVEVPLGNGTVTCQLKGPSGHYTTIGSFRVTAGYGAWGGPSPWPGAHVTGARILGPDGKVLITARFS